MQIQQNDMEYLKDMMQQGKMTADEANKRSACRSPAHYSSHGIPRPPRSDAQAELEDKRRLGERISTIFGVSRPQVSGDPGNDPALDLATDAITAYVNGKLEEAAERAIAWQSKLCTTDEWPCVNCTECKGLRAAIEEVVG